MSKNPSVKDYGGNCYVRNRRYRVKLDSGDAESFRCVDCGKYRFVTRFELARAARPKCQHCGGLLEETPATRTARGLPANRAAPGAVSGVSAKPSTETVEQILAKEKCVELTRRNDLPTELQKKLFAQAFAECSSKGKRSAWYAVSAVESPAVRDLLSGLVAEAAP